MPRGSHAHWRKGPSRRRCGGTRVARRRTRGLQEGSMTRRCFVAAVMVCSMAASASAAFGDSIRVFSDRDRFSADVGPVAVEPFGPSSCLGQRSTTLNAATGISCFPDYRVQAGVTFQAELHDNVFFPGLIIDSSGGFEGGFIDAIRPVDVAVSPLTVTFDAPVA